MGNNKVENNKVGNGKARGNKDSRINYENFYRKISAPIRRHPTAVQCLNRMNVLLTRVVYVAYPLFVLYLLWNHDERWIKVTAVPAFFFVLLTVIRRGINRQRPYEAWNISPLINKDTEGKSMPSRHVFSATIIAMAFFSIWQSVGVFFLIWSLLLAFIRILGGVHYPSDVFCGFLIGMLTGGIMLI